MNRFDTTLPIKMIAIEARKDTPFDMYIENAIAGYIMQLHHVYGPNENFKAVYVETLVNPTSEKITHVFEVGRIAMTQEEQSTHMFATHFNLNYGPNN